MADRTEESMPELTTARPRSRITAKGKFLFAGEEKLYVRGVTYGTFHPDEQGIQFPDRRAVDRDFAQMAGAGINAVRVYTPPPAWLLDIAWQYGLYVMIGLPWEQHIAFLDQAGLAASIVERVREAVRTTAGHPSVLCYVIGNEIPASVVRWHGPRRVEGFLRRLYDAVKAEAPEQLVTYVNFPTTKYLALPFLDFFSFNVYLERPEDLEAYIAELQTVAGDRPLVMAEIGLDSRRNGDAAQQQSLDWQIRTIFAAGCAGVFVFAWTDEWYRGGFEIEDWDFGLTRRNREAKPALESVRAAFASVPFPDDVPWPTISVVVCTHNGARTLRGCLEGLGRLAYSQYEVLVVDDGSTDETASIAAEFPVELIRTGHLGLSSARNAGMEAARGEIVAYIDDDAWPDPHWLHYLAWTYLRTDCAAAGGPNIPPLEDGPIAECVANAPGGPVHVLLTDREAEHIPGCNASFRKDRLQAIGGFDPRFRAAGDDVDICWRLLDRHWKIGFHAGAMVWHRRRSTIAGYWSQQRGYGRAEALLEAKWPSKYNASGSVKWKGRLYGGTIPELRRGEIYQGIWGTAPFQRLYAPMYGSGFVPTIEWLAAIPVFIGLLLAAPGGAFAILPLLLGIWIAVPALAVARSVARAPFRSDRFRYRLLTGFLHVIQPLARWQGRFGAPGSVKSGPAPRLVLPAPRVLKVWSERWGAPEDWLRSVEALLLSDGVPVRKGGEFDAWDLEIRAGIAASARIRMGVEEHGSGKQMLLFRVQPRIARASAFVSVLLSLAFATGVAAGHAAVAGVFGVLLLGVLLKSAHDCAAAAGAAEYSVRSLGQKSGAEAGEFDGVVYLGSS